MLIRPVNLKKDYKEICKWWELQQVPIVPVSMLSQNGVLCQDGDKKIAAAWLYLTDSCMAWIEFFIANPECDKMIRRKALNRISAELIRIAEENKKTVIFTCIALENMKDLANRFNFVVTNENCSAMLRVSESFKGDK